MHSHKQTQKRRQLLKKKKEREKTLNLEFLTRGPSPTLPSIFFFFLASSINSWSPHKTHTHTHTDAHPLTHPPPRRPSRHSSAGGAYPPEPAGQTGPRAQHAIPSCPSQGWRCRCRSPPSWSWTGCLPVASRGRTRCASTGWRAAMFWWGRVRYKEKSVRVVCE